MDTRGIAGGWSPCVLGNTKEFGRVDRKLFEILRGEASSDVTMILTSDLRG